MDDQFDGSLGRVIELLSAHDLEFALIGGLASSIRGRIRVTEDIDVVVDCDIPQAIELLEKLDEKSFRPFVEDPQLSIRQYYMLPIEDLVSGIRIDLAIGVSGFEKLVVQRASASAVHSIPVATAEDLLLMKLMAGRPQDQSDVQGIVSVNRETIDWEYCREVAGQLQEAFDFDLVEAIGRLEKPKPDSGQ